MSTFGDLQHFVEIGWRIRAECVGRVFLVEAKYENDLLTAIKTEGLTLELALNKLLTELREVGA